MLKKANIRVCVYLDNLLPTQLKIVLRLWKSRDTLKSSKNAFNWISESSKIFSRFDRKRVSLHELLHLSSLCPSYKPLKWMYSHHGKECCISFFLSHTSLLVIHLLWRPVGVAECFALQMALDEGSWVMLKDWPQCFIIPRESDPKGHSTHTGLILEQLISSQESFMCEHVCVFSRVLCCS